jgi:hypothetical protein
MSPIVSTLAGTAARGYGGLGASVSAGLLPGSYESISTVTVGSGGQAFIEFTSIPATYKHLQIRAITKDSYSAAAGWSNAPIYFNGDNAGGNYSSHTISGNGASPTASGSANTSGQSWWNSNVAMLGWAGEVWDFLDYANTDKFKTFRGLGGADNNGSPGTIWHTSNAWRSTSAITSIRMNTDNLFAQYTQFALYGIKGS